MKRWPVNKAYFWETAPFFRILLPFAAGILCYYKTPLGELSVSLIMLLTLLLAGLFIVSVLVNKAKLSAPLIHLLLLCSGAALSAINDIRNDAQWFGDSISTEKEYVARITSTPAEKEKSWKLTVHVINALDDRSIENTSGKAFVYLQKSDMPMLLHKYDTIILPGHWKPITDAGNPFEFSYASYCALNNIFHTQWCFADELRLLAPCNLAALPLTDRVNQWCMQRLKLYLGGHPAMGLLQAMLLGDEVNLDNEMRLSYSKTGIVHIIAISGGNVAMLFVVVVFLMGWLRHRKYIWLKYLVALPFVWFYVLMAGAQPSAVRAAVMFSILAGGYLFSRSPNSLNQLFATAFILLVAQPAWLFSVGFQLSFIAVLSIILFYRPVNNLLADLLHNSFSQRAKTGWSKWAYRTALALWSVVAMSIAAEILIAPIVICYFHSFPLMFIVANVAAYLFMSLILLAGILLVLLGGIPFLATAIAGIVKYLVDVFGSIVDNLQALGPASFNRLWLSGWDTAIVYVAIAGIAVFLLRKKKQGLFVGLTASCLLMLSFSIAAWNRLHRRMLVVYNSSYAAHTELIHGVNYSVLSTDTAHRSSISYATQAAHIAWRVQEQTPADTDRKLVSVGGKSVLLADSLFMADPAYHYDVLILNHTLAHSLDSVLTPYTPELVVISAGLDTEQRAALTLACDNLGIDVYDVTVRGAYVLAD